jgi:hypothetical protein
MDLLTKAKTLAERVEAEAMRANVPVAVCIVDVRGNLVLQHRMNGAQVVGAALTLQLIAVTYPLCAITDRGPRPAPAASSR